MPKIITITFSPCVDKSARVAELVAEKKMHCIQAKSEPGGGGINVARVLNTLGGNVMAVFPSGGCTGTHLNKLLQIEKIPFDAILSKNETRENFAILDKASNKQYRFGMPANELFEDEWMACLKVIENQKNVDYIVASGSLPIGVPLNVYAQLLKIAQKSQAKLIVDTSGDALKEVAKEHVYLLKPNLEELGILLNKDTIKIEEVEVAARELINRGKCEIVVTSLGINGAILVTKEKTYKANAPKVEVKSTIGAGDSMVAGLVFALSNGESLEKSLQYGVACGTAATMNPGSELCKMKDVEMLLKLLAP
ncbi:MAG: 1-phosphofructokinase family hexose kinase [Flavobacterium sp. JAD_PAG50586_2]|nr:MAG: 1-phosphofructokinase family hexose kinase [Flavobacterium sp. JAD_PAG50586_2]